MTSAMIKGSIRKAGKLKEKSLAELLVRSSQLIASSFERSGLSRAAREPELATVCFDGRSASRGVDLARLATAFPGLADLDASREALRLRLPLSTAELLAEADAIVAGHFQLLGHRDLCFGDPIDWHLDPTTGRRAPLAHWSRINFLDSATVGDHKVVWELNRHQHFLTLGQAYCLTGDDKYAGAFANQLTSWMNANPPTRGVNWASSLEVAFRAIAWIWALALFRKSDRLTEELRARVVALLHVHGRHIERYLSTYFSPNTHLTGEALGLFYLGTFLPQLRRADRWRRLGWRVLSAQIERHVLPDGVYFEQASYYQRYTADFYLHLLLIGAATRMERNAIHRPLNELLEHLVYLQRPDGTTPYVGDDDGGRLLPLDRRAPNDFRSTMATAAVLFDRADFRHAAGTAGPELVWLLGPVALTRFEAMPAVPPAFPSRAFGDGGYYVSRDGWTEDANYSLLDCGPHGIDNCGHAHADALAIEIAARGRTMLVDPGTYTYTSPLAERDRFRATSAHNTITLDEASSSSMAGPFHWSHIAQATARAWYSSSRFDFFHGTHDGFRRLPGMPTHTRSVLFIRGDYWIVRDEIESATAHEIVSRYQCAADIQPTLEGASDVTLGSPNDSRCLLLSTHASSSGQLSIEQAWISPAYGVRLPAARCAFRIGPTPKADILTALIPFSLLDQRPLVSSVATMRGHALRIRGAENEDLLLVGDERGGGCAGDIETDARWMWLRRDPATDEIRELILIDGHKVVMNGEVLCDRPDRERWVCARRVATGWLVQSDDGEQITATLCVGAPPCAASAA